MPKPPAAFSPLIATKSSFQSRRSAGSRSSTILRPLRPTISPMKRMRMGYWSRVELKMSDGTQNLVGAFDGGFRDWPVRLANRQARNCGVHKVNIHLIDRGECSNCVASIVAQFFDHRIGVRYTCRCDVEYIARLRMGPAIIDLLGDDFRNGLQKDGGPLDKGARGRRPRERGSYDEIDIATQPERQ